MRQVWTPKRWENDGITPLQTVALCGHLAVVKALLGSGADIHKMRSDSGETVLMLAVFCDHLAVVEALLEAGADAKVMRDDEVTALSIAMESGKGAIVAALQRHERSG